MEPRDFEDSRGPQAEVRIPKIVTPVATACTGGVRTVTYAPGVAASLASWRDCRLSGSGLSLVNPQAPLMFRWVTSMWGGVYRHRHRQPATLLWADDFRHDDAQVWEQGGRPVVEEARAGATAEKGAAAVGGLVPADGEGLVARHMRASGSAESRDHRAARLRTTWWRRAGARLVRTADGAARASVTSALESRAAVADAQSTAVDTGPVVHAGSSPAVSYATHAPEGYEESGVPGLTSAPAMSPERRQRKRAATEGSPRDVGDAGARRGADSTARVSKDTGPRTGRHEGPAAYRRAGPVRAVSPEHLAGHSERCVPEGEWDSARHSVRSEPSAATNLHRDPVAERPRAGQASSTPGGEARQHGMAAERSRRVPMRSAQKRHVRGALPSDGGPDSELAPEAGPGPAAGQGGEQAGALRNSGRGPKTAHEAEPLSDCAADGVAAVRVSSSADAVISQTAVGQGGAPGSRHEVHTARELPLAPLEALQKQHLAEPAPRPANDPGHEGHIPVPVGHERPRSGTASGASQDRTGARGTDDDRPPTPVPAPRTESRAAHTEEGLRRSSVSGTPATADASGHSAATRWEEPAPGRPQRHVAHGVVPTPRAVANQVWAPPVSNSDARESRGAPGTGRTPGTPHQPHASGLPQDEERSHASVPPLVQGRPRTSTHASAHEPSNDRPTAHSASLPPRRKQAEAVRADAQGAVMAVPVAATAADEAERPHPNTGGRPRPDTGGRPRSTGAAAVPVWLARPHSPEGNAADRPRAQRTGTAPHEGAAVRVRAEAKAAERSLSWLPSHLNGAASMPDAASTRWTESWRALDRMVGGAEAAVRTGAGRARIYERTTDPRGRVTWLQDRLMAKSGDGQTSGPTSTSLPEERPRTVLTEDDVADLPRAFSPPRVASVSRTVPAGAEPFTAQRPIGRRAASSPANGPASYAWRPSQNGQQPAAWCGGPQHQAAATAGDAVGAEPVPHADPVRARTTSRDPSPHRPRTSPVPHNHQRRSAVRGGGPAGHTGLVTPIAAGAPHISLDSRAAYANVPVSGEWFRSGAGLPFDRPEPQDVMAGPDRQTRWGVWPEQLARRRPAKDEEPAQHEERGMHGA